MRAVNLSRVAQPSAHPTPHTCSSFYALTQRNQIRIISQAVQFSAQCKYFIHTHTYLCVYNDQQTLIVVVKSVSIIIIIVIVRRVQRLHLNSENCINKLTQHKIEIMRALLNTAQHSTAQSSVNGMNGNRMHFFIAKQKRKPEELKCSNKLLHTYMYVSK